MSGQYAADMPLLVGITNLSDPSIRVRDADGVSPDGIPYYDFSSLVAEAALDPGALTGFRSIAFHDPQRMPFTYDLVFLSRLNRAPAITTVPDVEALPGRNYHYDVDATDANNDPLTFSLVAGPADMQTDPASGQITWSPATTDAGIHAVTVRVEDGRGSSAEQHYVLSVNSVTPNRPPLFTSVPVVAGYLNTPYAYQATASDPDDDPLTFTLIAGPDGMTVDPVTGLVAWTPAVEHLGLQQVALQVNDGRDGTATQAFFIRTQQEPGNHAPIIVSDPVTLFHLPGESNPPTGTVNPLRIDLDLAAGEFSDQSVAVTLAASGHAYADVVLVVDESGSMQGEHDWIEDMIPALEEALLARGIGPNRYAIVGFGGVFLGSVNHEQGHFLNLNSGISLFLHAPDNTQVASRQLANILPITLLDTIFPVNGIHTLAVQGNTTGDPKTYGFRTVTPTTRTTSLTLGQEVYDSLLESGDVHTYTFTLSDAATLYFDTLIESRQLTWGLTGPAGTVVDTHTFRSNVNGTAFFSDVLLPTLPAGDYTLTVTGLELPPTHDLTAITEGSSGAYRFRLSDVAQASALTPGQPVSGLLDPTDEANLYRFDAVAGDRVYVDLLAHTHPNAHPFDPDTRWLLLDPLGNTLASVLVDNRFPTPPWDSSRGDLDTLTLAQSGTYTIIFEGAIEAGGFRGNSSYTFSVRQVTDTTAPLTLGSTMNADLGVPGERDQYTFTLPAASLCYFDSFTHDGDFTWTLTGPAGTPVSGRQFDQSDAFVGFNPVLNLPAGDYTLTVDGDRRHHRQLWLPLSGAGQCHQLRDDPGRVGDRGTDSRELDQPA